MEKETNTKHDTHPLYTQEDIYGAKISREEALERIKSDAKAYKLYQNFPKDKQEQLLAFIQGNQGLEIMHDSFSQYVLNPEKDIRRMESLLSAALDQKVHIIKVLKREGTSMRAEGSLVVLDFFVQLSDGTYTDLEIQQVGYKFSGERSNCYQADIIMRQYNQLKAKETKENPFSYKQLKPVILIVIMKDSPACFRAVAPKYIHREQHIYDSGAKVANLTQNIYISLDTYNQLGHNISTELDAWLTFLGSDNPAQIVKLVNEYPEFLPYYKDIQEFRTNTEELMNMFSEALIAADRNDALEQIEDLKKEANDLKKEADGLKKEADGLKKEADDLKKETDDLKKEADDLKKEADGLKKEADDLKKQVIEKKAELAQKDAALADKNTALAEKDTALAEKDAENHALKQQLAEQQALIAKLQKNN